VTERPATVRTWRRLDTLPEAQKLALAAIFVALGVLLSTFSVPIGPARVFPFQHVINVVAGILIGPWYAVLSAIGISVIRNALGTGTLLAFPGSIFGALFVGYAYRWLRRSEAAFVEPLGTVIVGGLVGYALIAGLAAPTTVLGFLRANPPAAQPYLGLFGGPLAIVASFAVSSIPGTILGYLVIQALRRAGIR
jgi:energy coupling factor transporter S component ThiW